MRDLTEPILELIRLAATDLPPDVEPGSQSSYDVTIMAANASRRKSAET